MNIQFGKVKGGGGALILRMGAYNTGILGPGGPKIMGGLKFYDRG